MCSYQLFVIMRLVVAFVALSFGMPAARAATAYAPQTPNATGVVLAANTETKKQKTSPAAKKKAPAKDKAAQTKAAKGKPAKEKTSKGAPSKTTTAQEKKPAGKALKARTAPAKTEPKSKKTAAAAPKDHAGEGGSSSLMGLAFVAFIALAGIGLISFVAWREMRPTVYPSGKSYGPTDYLPASKGGAFTLEYHADPMKQWAGGQTQANAVPAKPAPGKAAPQGEPPVTVTREPLHAKSKFKESA